uniref:TEP1-F n=1 Tax=Hasarius adansoni TaxID=243517 RepID=G1UIC7_9ARAC|nr:alpha-2 macroglobulin [Hasarius adansoni]
MDNLTRFLVLCCTLCSLTIAVRGSKGNFILTAPRAIDAGSIVYFTLTVFDIPQGGTVTLRLTHLISNVLIAESRVSVHNNYNTWVEMNVPPMSSDISATLHIIGSFSSDYHIEASQNIHIRHNTILTFIQTDKPLYKPGQTIRFRVLPMDNQLKPLDANTMGDIWIEDPSGIRVAQWNHEQFTEGIKQFELPLSGEPPLGTWNIHAFINQVTTSQTFIVKKYVLPKFDVSIKPPAVIMADAQTIPIEVCAKYTYGKYVEGSLKAKVTYKKLWTFMYRDQRTIPSVEHQAELPGCHTFQVNTDDLLMQTEEFGGKELEIFAEVTENVTGIVRNATTSFEISHQKVFLEFLRDNDYYKPKMPYVGQLEAKNPDGTPALSEKIQICVTLEGKQCLIFTSDKNGLIGFAIKPSPVSRDIRVEATTINYEDVHYSSTFWTRKLRKPTATMILSPWYSPSWSYLQIQPTTEEFECDKAQKVTVQYTAERGSTIKFYHQVLSKGRIVQQGSHQRTFYSKVEEIQYDFEEQIVKKGSSSGNSSETEIGEFILAFDTRATMSPISRLLIFYVRDDKEVVADSRKFRIKKCLQNKVSLHFRHEQQYPNTEATMLLSASPSSLCGIHMVDKSIRLLEDDTTFNTDKLFKIMESYDTGKDPTEFPGICIEDSKEDKPRMPRNMIFQDTFPRSGRPYVDARQAFEEAGMTVITDLKLKSYHCTYYELPIPLMLPDSRYEDTEPQFITRVEALPSNSEEIRSFFPETWLWELHSVDSTGETAIKRQLPHTITEWVGGAVCVHPKTGLGIWDISSVTTFQPFFIDFHLPYSVIRGESFPLVVTVFNYLSECLPIKLSLEPSDDYTLLTELRFQKTCVCGGQSSSVSFPVRPATLGMVNFTVYGYSIEQDDEACGNEITARLSARDAITKEILVEAEGFPKEDVFNYFICPENTNGSFATEIPLLLPDDVIMDSARAYMTITGDVMGPSIKGLKKLVSLPFGCGEQNMVLFVPNIFVLDYLTSTEKLTDDIKEECLHNMKTGYQRELQYKHSDGSYSAFGASDKEGSLWLTAFVLRSFGQARRFMNVDENDLSATRSWILKKQFENGCFIPSGTVLNKEMKGGLSSSEQSLAPLTAYVLISLLESDMEKHDTLVVKNALKCLESEKQPNIYVLSLFAYASALAKENETYGRYLDELDKRAITKDYMKYWEPSSNSKSVAVEIASYYMLARFEMEEAKALKSVLPVVRWITHQRNSYGGFISTQDTVVALQALAKYASYISKNPVDIALAVETDDMTQGFKLDESNKLVTQQLKIVDLPTTVDIDAYGDGCAVVQFSLRYNVEKVSNTGGLELNVNARRRGSNECNLPSLGICMRYAVHKEKTNMAVLSVKLPSGYVADEWSLLLLENDKEVQLMRHEIEENVVNLYFEEITNDARCFEFHVKSEFEVENVMPSIIRLYDYYQPDRQVTKDYSIPSTCNSTFLPDLTRFPLFKSSEPLHSDFDEFQEFSDTLNGELPEIITPPETTDYQTESRNVSGSDWNSEETPDHLNDSLYPLEVLETSNSIDQREGNISQISTFVDVDHDLDFPDGLEGNMPVSVLPPPDFVQPDCPVCSDSFPSNFSAVYCNSAFALKVMKRENNMKTVKIIQDVSFYIDSPKAIKKFGELEYEEECTCTELAEDGKILFIVGSPLSLWNSNGKKHRIHLTSSVHVLLVPPKQIYSFITEAKSSCANDP